MSIIGALHLFFMVVMLCRSVRRRELVSLYWGIACFLAGLPLTVTDAVHLETSPSHEFDGDVWRRAELFCIGFNLLLAAVTTFRARRRVGSGAVPVNAGALDPAQQQVVRRVFWWVSLLFLAAALAVAWVTAGSLSAVATLKWTTFAEQAEGQTQYSFVAANTALIVFSVAAPLAILLDRRLIAGALVTLAFLTAQLCGTRTYFLPSFLSVTMLLAFRLFSVKTKRPFRSLVRLVAITFAIVLALEGMAFVTWTRGRYDAGSVAAAPGAAWAQFRDERDLGVDASAGAMLYTFEAFPDSIPYCDGLTYREMALTPVPASLLRGVGLVDAKTHSFSGIILARSIFGTGYESRFGSIHPTLWGDAYANFGLWGILLGALWGGLFRLVDRQLRGRPLLAILLLPPYASFMAVLVRGSMLHAMLYGWNSILLISLLMLMVYVVNRKVWRIATRRPRLGAFEWGYAGPR